MTLPPESAADSETTVAPLFWILELTVSALAVLALALVRNKVAGMALVVRKPSLAARPIVKPLAAAPTAMLPEPPITKVWLAPPASFMFTLAAVVPADIMSDRMEVVGATAKVLVPAPPSRMVTSATGSLG